MFSALFASLGTKVAAAATAAAFLAGGAAGSAAIGGPNVASSVHEVISDSDHPGGAPGEVTDADTVEGTDTETAGGHETCSEATQGALERLNELLADGKPVDNAIDAVENCGNGAADAAEEDADTEDAGSQANPNASEQSGNANDGAGNANENASDGVSQANSNAAEGSGNAGGHAQGPR